MKIKRAVARTIYEAIARHLPCSHAPVNIGQEKLRRWCVTNFCGGGQIGKNIDIDREAQISSKVYIGNNSGVGRNSMIQGRVYIGNYVMMGPECQIWTLNHKIERTDIPMMQQGIAPESPVYIGDDVWIGSRVTILPGVKIGNGAVIGAGSIVTHDVEEYSVVAGNPAKKVRLRK